MCNYNLSLICHGDIFLLSTDDTNPHIFHLHYFDYYHAWVFDKHVTYYLQSILTHYLYQNVDLIDGLFDFDLSMLVLEVEVMTGMKFAEMQLFVEVLTGIDLV